MPPVPSNRHTLHSASMASHHHDFVPITVGCPSGLGPGEPGDEVSEMTRSLRRPSVDSLDSAFLSLSVATPRVAAVSHPLMAPGDDDEAPPSRGVRGRGDGGLGGLGGHESFDDDVSDDPYGLDGGGEGEASTPSLFEERQLRPSSGGANAAKAAAAERNAAAQIMRASHVASSRQGGGGAPSPPSNLLRGVSAGSAGKAPPPREGGRRSSLSARAFRVHARRASSMDHLSPSDPPHPAHSTPPAAASGGYGWFGRGGRGGGAASTDAFHGGDGLEGDDGETMRGVLAELKVLLAEAQTEAESHRNLARKLLEENLSLKEQMNRREVEEGDDDGNRIGDRDGNGGNGRGNGNAASDLRDREREAEITRLRSEAKQLRKNEMDALAKINRLLREREKLRSENLTLAEKNVKESVERSAEYREKTAELERERDELRAECERLREEREEAVLERNELRSRTGRMSVMIPRKEAEREEVCPSLAAIGAAAAESNGGGGRASLNLGSLVSKFQSSRNVMGEIGGGGGRGGGGVGKLGLGGGGRGVGGGYPSKPRGPLSRQKSKTEVSPEDLLWDSYEGVGGGSHDDDDNDGDDSEDLGHGGAGAVDNGLRRGAHHGRNDWGMGAIREDRL